jgi:class 3 adenylate cyclase
MAQQTETTIPAVSAPVGQHSSMAILFADVCGSTKLYETHGDAKARGVIARSIALMTEATQEHGGTLIKTIGDEVMCRFPTADDAAAAALDMQEKVSGASLTGGGLNLAIHVGFHYGPVVQEEGDIFGDAVNVAARMVNLSKRDQVLTTGATVATLSPEWQKATRQIDRAAVRGKSEEIDVYEVIWQEAETTRMAGRTWEIPLSTPPGHLVLTQGAHEIEVSEKHPSVSVGRGDLSDLVMKGDLVSRLHARIDYRNGRFSLTDQSTNGTYVADQTGKVRLVRHDTQVLTGNGIIALGHQPEKGQTDLIHYVLSS